MPAALDRAVLDLGSGDGRLLALVRRARPETEAVAIDFSETMLDLLRERFAGDARVRVVAHDLSDPLPAASLGRFDAIVSSFAIHHLTHPRKRESTRRSIACSRRAASSSTSNTSRRPRPPCITSSWRA